MKRPGPVKAYLIDIEGVLVRDKRYEPVPGAVGWMTSLVAAGRPFCLVSNNTTHRPGDLVDDLARVGFPVTESHLVGALGQGMRWLRDRNKGRIRWLGTTLLEDYWREEGFEIITGGSCDAVVLGANSGLKIRDLDSVLGPVLDEGTDLLCLHRNLFYLDESGRRRLGPGAWAAALEALGGAGQVVTVGKPSEGIYREGLKRVGVTPDEALFISDDPISDLVTAGRLGMRTAFVLSGKYPDHGVLARLEETEWPDIVCSRMSDLDIQEEETV
ncbi:MAG: HAD hydrolase-like protein [Candidatus Krumholzibacteria bacterium]|nr:HAD hydrolase-like protein [Candidatus Krumholzibacteria bacterium]